MSIVNAKSCSYCFLDLDFDNHRSKLATAAAFVDATDSRYGFSSKDLRKLGGSELSRVDDLISTDHEWSSRNEACGGIKSRPPLCGNRIVVKLFWNIAPLACENFATLCLNGSLLPSMATKNNVTTTTKNKKPTPPIGESGKPLTYRDSIVHRVIPGFILQGGDFVFGNGSGGESIYNGKKFKDERAGLALQHDRKGVLSMGNSGKNSNSSQFFITFQAAPQCDGKHVVFGEVVSGYEVLEEAEKYGTAEGEPSVPIKITDCGVYAPLMTPGAGYWYDQPDAESYSGISPVFVVRPRVVVLAPTQTVAHKFQSILGKCCHVRSVVLDDGDKASSSSDQTKLIQEWLDVHAIDVVIVAPACSKLLASFTCLPDSWKSPNDNGTIISLDTVIFEAKPVDALKIVCNKTWLATTKWQLDGSGSS